MQLYRQLTKHTIPHVLQYFTETVFNHCRYHSPAPAMWNSLTKKILETSLLTVFLFNNPIPLSTPLKSRPYLSAARVTQLPRLKLAWCRKSSVFQVLSVSSSFSCVTRSSHVWSSPCGADYDIRSTSAPSDKTRSTLSITEDQIADNNTLLVQRTSLKFGERAFSVAGPAAWNSLPTDIRTTNSTPAFKKKLKTFLFSKFYDI